MAFILKIILINLFIDAIIGCFVFVARNWITARIEKGVQHGFDIKIERLRSELKNAEEVFRNELRGQETELSLLRSNALGGAARRAELKDKRRFEAAEKIWAEIFRLAPLTSVSAMMSRLNIEELREYSKDNSEKTSELIGLVLSGMPDNVSSDKAIAEEQLYVSDLAWAYFEAYRSIITFAYLEAKAIKIAPDAGNLMNTPRMKDILIKTLPQYKDYIEKNPPNVYYHLLDNIRDLLFAELRRDLDGTAADTNDIERARVIVAATRLTPGPGSS